MAAPLDPACIFRALAEHDVEYVLIGGLAAVLPGSSAVTNDADILPSKDEDNLRHLSDCLRSLDARIRTPDEPAGVGFDPHPSLLGSVAMLNMTTRCGDLDLTFSPAALDDYARVRDRAVEFEIYECRVSVAALDDIIRSKEAAARPKDHATLPILRALREELEDRG